MVKTQMCEANNESVGNELSGRSMIMQESESETRAAGSDYLEAPTEGSEG